MTEIFTSARGRFEGGEGVGDMEELVRFAPLRHTTPGNATAYSQHSKIKQQ